MRKQAGRRFLGRFDGKKYGWLLLARDFALMLAGVALFFTLLLGVSRVDGSSMEPTLRDGQPVLYSRVCFRFNRGDVVCVRMPSGENYVKRIAALEGDVVDLRDGVLYINGAAEDNPNAQGANRPQAGIVSYPYTVGEDMVFLLGDNRESSQDSRAFGAMPLSSIRGKILILGG